MSFATLIRMLLTIWPSIGVQLARIAKNPVVLSQGGVPTGIGPSGSFANNGVWTAGTALPTTYSGGCYLYFPANTIGAGVPAGLYYTVMSSTTVGTVYNNTYTSGVPLPPSSPTAFVTTGPGAYTQSTAELTINTITVPGDSMGANGSLRYGSKVSVNSSANAKTVNVKYGGTTMLNGTTSTAGVSSFRFQNGIIGNQNATNKQVGEAGGSFGGANGVNSGTIARGTVDSTTDQSLTVTATLGVATEYVILESSLIEVMQSN